MKSIFLSHKQLFENPLPLFRTAGAEARASDLVLVTIPDDGFTLNGDRVNYFLSGEDCADRFGRDHRSSICAVRPALLLEPSMQLDYDWFPADRIRDGILIEQFRPYPVPHAEILLDTSASIDEDLLRAFVRGVREILQEDAVVKVGCFDTEFYGFQEIHSEKDISKLEIKGSGGTNFETAVRAFTGDAETKIVFTDGYADMPETRSDAIWLVYSDMPVDPPGGKVIYVKKPEEINRYEVDFLIT